MKRLPYLILLLFAGLPIQAQTGTTWILPENAGNFFACLVGGILLAMAFQFLLTNLGLAVGISSIGNIRKNVNEDSTDSGNSDSNSTPLGVKITSGLGGFLMISMSIALFFASLIAVKLSLIPTDWISVTLGLIIWAGFLMISLWIETRMISGLMGSVFMTARRALVAGTSTVSGIFSSEGSRVSPEKTARKTVEAIHDELRQEYDLGQFEKKLDEYVEKLEPEAVDMDDMHHRLVELLRDLEINEQLNPDDPRSTKKVFLEIAGEQRNITAKDRERLGKAFDHARSAMKEGDSRKSKITKLVDKLSPGSEKQGRTYRKKIEEYLRTSDQEALSPDKLEEDLHRILNNPRATPEVLRDRVSELDSNTIVALLSNNGMTEEQAERYMRKAEQVINYIREKTGETRQMADRTRSQVEEKVQSKKEEGRHKATEKKIDVEMKIRTWFNRMDRPELKYERLKLDAIRMMDDPKVAPRILRKRLEKLDRESLKALLSNNKRIDREQIDEAIRKIEEARDKVIRKAEVLEQEARRRLEQAKQEALRQAEATRKTAASAAWWLFAAALLSGGASALGGILALSI